MAQLRRDPVERFWVVVSEESLGHPLNNHHIGNGRHAEPETCPFCEGHEAYTPPEISAYGRTGQVNTFGWKVRVVPNTSPALQPQPPEVDRRGIGLYDVMNGIGAHEVVIETPRHNEGWADFDTVHANLVLQAWGDRLRDLHRDFRLRYVMICKNHGPFAGARLAHAHSIVVALATTPKRVEDKLRGARDYYQIKERCVYCDMLAQELDEGSRVVYENGSMVLLCPFAARFPFELLVMPKRHASDFTRLQSNEQSDLAITLIEATRALNTALDHPDYNMVLHTAPNPTSRPNPWRTIEHDFHWHVELIPRIFSIAGFEWGTGCYINPTSPESAAAYLRHRRDVWSSGEERSRTNLGQSREP